MHLPVTLTALKTRRCACWLPVSTAGKAGGPVGITWVESWRGEGWSPDGERGSPTEIWAKNCPEREQRMQSPDVGGGLGPWVLFLMVEGVTRVGAGT